MLGWVIWITGLPGSGKSTVTHALHTKLEKRGIKVNSLLIDELRKIVTPQPTYTEKEREYVYGALVYTAIILTQINQNVIIDATANKRSYREKARKRIENFLEVYLKCPLHICKLREHSRVQYYGAPKGIYTKGEKAQSKTVPGIGVAYEEPLNPEVIIESALTSTEQAVHQIINVLKERHWI